MTYPTLTHFDKLTPPQKEAVLTTDGPLLVLAGAGSGKTRVVTLRIAHLIWSGIPADKILGLTFTNKAAQEMRHRVQTITQEKVFISTFHALGAFILRESIHHLGYKNSFTIYDEEDCDKLLKTLFSAIDVEVKRADLKAIRRYISEQKNKMLLPQNPDTAVFIDPADAVNNKVFYLYQEALASCQALDFDDLLFLTVRLFQEHPEVLHYYQERWHYLLIDEYQDTNHAQYTLINLLVEKSHNLCVVGDPDQSIYSWRGANLHNILNFEKDYPNARVIRLEQNFRSMGTILDAANALIRNNTERLEKNLWTAQEKGHKIRLFAAESESQEALFVQQEIERQKMRGRNLSEIVVFYRTNAQSRSFEDRLLSKNIPYVIVGGVSFYQRREIKDILAFLKVLLSDNDLIAFERTINIPKRGLGDTTLEKLRLDSRRANLPIVLYAKKLIHGEIEGVKLSAKQKAALKEYLEIIFALRTQIQSLSVGEIVMKMVEASGYFNHLKEDPETATERRENVEALVAKAFEWQEEQPEGKLEQLLEELSLKSTLDETLAPKERVHLMTIHNGKGLEFEVTFLVGMEETLFPHVNSLGNNELIEEERRLCYVGITRAKQELFMTYARGRSLWGSFRMMAPSRFLREIPPEAIERVWRL